MKIVKPYGDSNAALDPENGLYRRKLRLRDRARSQEDVVDYAQNHPELVIAQWISVIDKIATKPKGNTGPTREQWQLRDKLGRAAWREIACARRIDSDRLPALEALWDFKIHPYGRTKFDRPARPVRLEGRWYSRFAGSTKPELLDADSVAAAIDAHLHEAARRLHDRSPDRAQGLITARAASIVTNTLQLASERTDRNRRPLPEDWSDIDAQRYFASNDPSREIYAAAQAKARVNRLLRLSDAAAILSQQWSRVFGTEARHMADIPVDQEGMLALHIAIRGTYRGLLKRTDAKPDTLAQRMPRNREQLIRLIDAQDNNRRRADLIRRGKLIHYTASEMASAGGGDTTAAVFANWPVDVAQSPWRSSEGQAKIKRAEAFVRIWRHTMALAALTMRDWASMNKDIKDVFGGTNKADEAAGRNNFDAEKFRAKAQVVFGSAAENFRDSTNLLKSLIRLGIQLRCNSFHFTGRGGFLGTLAKLGGSKLIDPKTLADARNIWQRDLSHRGQRICDALTAVDAPFFFNADQLQHLLDALHAATTEQALPLPRFRRVIERAHNVKPGRLPPPAKRRQMEADPAQRCRYLVLKALYQGPFKQWLTHQDAATVSALIKQALDRTTAAARGMNGQRLDAAQRDLITARAHDLLLARDDFDLADFLSTLSGHTAAEMRVQNGYQSDGDQARKQAGHLDDIQCDVIALAFADWLSAQAFGFVAALPDGAEKPSQPLATLAPPAAAPAGGEDWQVALYLFIHLVPPGDIGRLLHQLAKWELTASRDAPLSDEEQTRLAALRTTLTLYLDEHDCKFSGTDPLTAVKPFADTYEARSSFDSIFAAAPGGAADQRIPRRGLRQLMRFGHRGVLDRMVQLPRVTDTDIATWRRAEAEVAGWHEARETIHAKWVNQKGGLSDDEKRRYDDVVRQIAGHRHLTARVMLQDRVDLHGILMRCLGRMVDFSGLFERDLYFAMLAVMDECAVPQSVIATINGAPELQKLLRNGQIIDFWREITKQTSPIPLPLRNELLKFIPNGELIKIRNKFAHFDWLHQNAGIGANITITEIVNDCRELMAYDRKLKNAVAKSLIDLMAREGFDVRWAAANHKLTDAKVASRRAKHLRGKGADEPLHGPGMVASVAALFGGTVAEPAPAAIGAKKPSPDARRSGQARKKFGGKSQFHYGKSNR